MNEEINQLEQYLLAKDRKAFVDALIKDTDSHYFFSLLEAIDSSSGKLTPEQETDLRRYRQFRTVSSKGIRVRYLFRKYDQASSEEEKKSILEILNQKLFKVDGIFPEKKKKKKDGIKRNQQLQSPGQRSQESDSQESIQRLEEEEIEPAFWENEEDDERESRQQRAIPMKGSTSSLGENDLFQDLEEQKTQEQGEQMEIEQATAQAPKEENKSKLDNQLLNVDKVIEKGALSELLGLLSDDSLIRIPLKKITQEKEWEIIGQYLDRVEIYSLSTEELTSILTRLLTIAPKTKGISQALTLPFRFNAFTLDQLESAVVPIPELKTNKNYIRSLFLKKFQLSEIVSLKGDSLFAKLNEILAWSKTLNSKFYSLQEQITYEILYQGIQNDNYDFELFQKYIQNPKNQLPEYNKQSKKQFNGFKKQYDPFWESVHQFSSVSYSQSKLVKKYVKKYFQHNKSTNISQFDSTFSKKYLEQLLAKTRLYSGDQNISNVSQSLSPEEIAEIYSSKEVKIFQQNKSVFAQNEPVKLSVRLKNIDKMFVKVFNFLPENYYIKHQAEFNHHIDLDGLNPSEEVKFDFTEGNIHPCTRFTKTFDFESISKANKGIFIVEFFSSGIASRAIIYKGTLSHFSRTTIAGQEILILDETGTIQTGERVGIWLDSVFYQADKNTGRILIPFSASSSFKNVILVSGSFAKLASFQHESENFVFSSDFIYNQESFILGNQVRMIIEPNLKINSEVASLEIVKEVEISIVTTTTEDVPQTTRINLKHLQNNKAIVAEFPLPAKTKNVKINLTGKITPMTKKEDITVSAAHNININQHIYSLSYSSLLLHHSDQYYLVALGKNGESLKGISVDVTLTHQQLNKVSDKTLNFETDEQGRIALGQLLNVLQIFASFSRNSQNVSGSWHIDRQRIRGLQSLPKIYDISENATVRIPLLVHSNTDETEQVDRSLFSLVQLTDNDYNSLHLSSPTRIPAICISNKTSNIKIESGQLVISGLQSGSYMLRSKENSTNFFVKVHKNSQPWQYQPGARSLIDQNKLFLDLAESAAELHPRVEHLEYSSSKCKIQLSKGADYSNVRVHILAWQFYPDGLSNPIGTYQGVHNNYQKKQVNLAAPANKYMSNRQLGDEFAYVLDRKIQTRYIGNSLEKPSLALKRNLVKTTTFDTQQLRQDGRRRSRSGSVSPPNEELKQFDASFMSVDRRNSDPRSPRKEQCENQEFLDFSYCEFEENQIMKEDKKKRKSPLGNKNADDVLTFKEPAYSVSARPIDSHLNFLKKNCLILANLKPDGDGIIEFDSLLSSYSGIQVVLRTPTSHSVHVYDLASVEESVESRDLRQKSTLSKDKFYSIFRNTQSVLKGEICTVEDITSTEFQVIDSLNKVFDYQQELSRFTNTLNETITNKSYNQEWSFLKKWNTLDIQEKHAKYAQYTSHELNFFLFLKDNQFFQSVVLTHLANKIELSLVDMFLLGQHKRLLEKYFHLELLSTYNVFEFILIIMALISTNQRDKAQLIGTILNQQVKLNVEDKEIYKKYFDIILNNNNTNNNTNNNSAKLFGQAKQQGYKSKGGMKKIQKQQYQEQEDDDDACSESLESDDGEEEEEQFSDNQNIEFDDDDSDEMNDDFGRDRGGSRNRNNYAQDKKKERKEKAKTNQYKFNPFQPTYQQQRQLFQSERKGLQETSEYVERQYFNQKDSYEYSAELFRPNAFWSELANHLLGKSSFENFLSTQFPQCTTSHSEMIIILALLALPFESPTHAISSEKGIDQTLKAAENLLLFTKEIRETTSKLGSQIMINQRFFDPNDKFETQGDEKFEKNATAFITSYIYGCQVIVTNCTGGTQEVQALTEVPEGSIPVSTIEYTKTYTQKLDSYSTKIIEFYFYFPCVGNFGIYPANVSKNGEVLCVAGGMVFEVQIKPKEREAKTLAEVLQEGSKEKILSFLQERNWNEVVNQGIQQLKPILSFCNDKDFYLRLVAILRQQSIFNEDIWKYSLLHADQSTLVEYLNTESMRDCISKYVQHLKCSLLKMPQEIGEWKCIREYYPLLNSRVHLLKRDTASILNRQFRQTYCQFLRYLAEKGIQKLGAIDRLVFVYYLLLQDRVESAIGQFEQIDVKEITEGQGSIQYDYVAAYLDFYKGHPNFIVAREIIEKYLDYPVTSWRNLFYDMANQLSEYDGEDLVDQELKQLRISKEKTEEKVSSEKLQTFKLRMDDKQIVIEHKNVDPKVQLLYYKIDLEVFFSKKPFVSTISEDFSYLQASESETVVLNEEDKLATAPSVSRFNLPQNLQSSSVYIQALNSPFLKDGATYFSSKLKVSLFSDDAQLKVTDSNASPLSRIYIKVFSKNAAGTISFIKDGYTDLRGKFDYLLSSSVKLADIDRLSIFVTSDDLGSLILEAKPPKRIGQYSETVQLKSKNWNNCLQEKKLKNCRK